VTASEERTAAVRLAAALADTLNPTGSAGDVIIARALLYPTCLRTIAQLATSGYQLVECPPPAPIAA
jgi:hypothetical protein